jgi:hypothetical protein
MNDMQRHLTKHYSENNVKENVRTTQPS